MKGRADLNRKLNKELGMRFESARWGGEGASSDSLAALLVVLVHAGDELAETEVLDHGLEGGVVGDLDVLDLELGALGDEVHLLLALL